MISHHVFADLKLHSDEELAKIIGEKITERITIHEWPLSCVQKLTLESGKRLIYKSQLPPTVEADFYKTAETDLLPAHSVIGKLGNCDTMLIDWIDAPLLSEKAHDANELVQHGKGIIARISGIKGDLPVYLDIGSHGAWMNVMGETTGKLSELICDGRFKFIDRNVPEKLLQWSKSESVLEVINDSHIIHGDLKADQVFMLGDEYRIIDWQRPYRAPAEVDLVSLLVDRKVSPNDFASREVIGVFWLLRLHWAVEAQYAIFPKNKWPLFNNWASEAINNILS
jgi:hypothetical protein